MFLHAVFLAARTFIPYPQMNLFIVHAKGGSINETLIRTIFAIKTPVLVNPFVFHELPGSLERFMANVTLERLDIRMGFHVLQQVGARLIPVATHLASVIQARLVHFHVEFVALQRLEFG